MTLRKYSAAKLSTTSKFSASANNFRTIVRKTVSVNIIQAGDPPPPPPPVYMWTWGKNNFGQCGLGNTGGYRSSPSQVGTGTNWSKVAVAGQFMIGLKTDGTLWSWGYADYGVLGQGDSSNRSSPTQIGTDSNWTDVTVSWNAVQALKAGQRWTWGNSAAGQRGDSSTYGNVFSPVLVDNESWSKITSFPSQTDTFIGLKANGTLWAWGDNSSYQLGQGNTTNRSSPVQIGSDTTWTNIQGAMLNAFVTTK